MVRFLFLLISVSLLVYQAKAQTDGNPHNWDRKRRCDGIGYDPPCGLCEGYGGIPSGDRNDQIKLTTCEPVASPDEIDPATLKPVQWGTVWTLPQAYEILIGKKNDPFCFVTFPGNDSVGNLCYVSQHGQKWYDMEDKRALKEELTVETVIGNVQSTVLHQGQNFWISNRLPLGVHQCACVQVREAGVGDKVVYPIQYNWVGNLNYIGREKLGIEYINIEATLDHWNYGPHHVWVYPDTGNILRMWQPFNGLQIYPDGVGQGTVDPHVFDDIPPSTCKKGGALIRSGCDDDGYPVPKEDQKKKLSSEDHVRAVNKVPRHDYKGMDFGHMSQVLNRWLKDSHHVKPCDEWEVEELQELQSLLYMLRHTDLDDIYQMTEDSRRLRFSTLEDMTQTWKDLNAIASNHENPWMKRMRRDGHCHEAVMWFVHHLTEDIKLLLFQSKVSIPLLSHARHECKAGDSEEICRAYEKQVTCQDCHSNVLPPAFHGGK